MHPNPTKLMGWALVVVFAPLAFSAATVGWIQDGWDVPAVQCSRLPYPTIGGPFSETTRVTGQPSIFPLGVDCTYDVAGDGVGPQVVHNYNADATVVLVLSALAVVGGMGLIRERWPLVGFRPPSSSTDGAAG